MLNEKDIRQLAEKGIDRESFLAQIKCFQEGFRPLCLDRPATIGDGLRRMGPEDLDHYASFFEKRGSALNMIKFVPASGAASRMFKNVFAWKDLLSAGVEVDRLLDAHPQAAKFFSRLRNFAFWGALKAAMDKDKLDAAQLIERKQFMVILEYLLSDKGLGYALLPKALLPFHRYGQHVRTAMEEHLVEGALYCRGRDDQVNIHFTLSPEHIAPFKVLLKEVAGTLEDTYQVRYGITWSVQKPSTDTVAVNENNLPFRDREGIILFRPGGHGALIENLNDLSGDVVFIKNIDNVQPDRLKRLMVTYKKVLGGLLLQLQEEAFQWLRKLEHGVLTDLEYEQARDFACSSLNIDRSILPGDSVKGSAILFDALNRPLRVCGMVKNEGEPGGGPFWVTDPDTGHKSLQVVEMSQIDFSESGQDEIVKRATHFNPVDIVCGMRDFKGERFDLTRYVDQKTGFVSRKSKDGKEFKALEKPGLWNGAMARWNTVFVEVPLETFSPVKTVNDLLREVHQ